MIKLAMVSEHASPLATLGGNDAGGQNVHVAALARHVARRAEIHEVAVYTRRDHPRLSFERQLDRSVYVRHVTAGPPLAIAKDDLYGYMGEFASNLYEIWRIDRPDLVHAHFWMSAMASLEAARPLGIPVAVTFHALGIEKRRFQGKADSSPRDRLAVEARIAREADLIVATSRAEVKELAAMGADRERTRIVPCGVDLRLFTPEGPRAPRASTPRRVLVIGRLVVRKGIEDVISAMRTIRDAELLIAGGPSQSDLGLDPDARRLRAWAAHEGVEDRVRLIGQVPHDNAPALIRSADAVVCAPWYEPFGIVPLEAMACAVPVIVTSVGGLVDTVVDRVTGLHVPPRSPDSIARALRVILDQPKLANRLGQAGARRARAYGWQNIARSCLDCYREVLEATAIARSA